MALLKSEPTMNSFSESSSVYSDDDEFIPSHHLELQSTHSASPLGESRVYESYATILPLNRAVYRFETKEDAEARRRRSALFARVETIELEQHGSGAPESLEYMIQALTTAKARSIKNEPSRSDSEEDKEALLDLELGDVGPRPPTPPRRRPPITIRTVSTARSRLQGESVAPLAPSANESAVSAGRTHDCGENRPESSSGRFVIDVEDTSPPIKASKKVRAKRLFCL